jgi:DNA-binding response OmpR family regulator
MTTSGCILAADDEPSFLLPMAELLRHEGYVCECASDGNQAITMLQGKRHDALICDVEMPGNDQLRVVRIAKQFAPGMPVILVTGHPSVDSAVSSLDLPVVAYLTKPISFDRLLAEVREAMDLSHDYLVLSDICRHLRECCRALEEDRDRRTRHRNRDLPSVSPLVVRLLASCLSELVRLEADQSPGVNRQFLCDLLDCPEQPVCRQAIHETIEVLQKTKNTFKSKDLAELRARLERIVKKSPNSPHPA